MNKLKNRFIQLYIILFYYICCILVFIFRIKNDDVWLISERGDEARDNGYSFYKYLKKSHPDEKVKYIISKNSKDRSRIDSNDIVNYRSFSHYVYYITSKYLISTHTQGTAPEFHSFTKLDRKKLLFNKGKCVFLQHGITKDYIPIMNKEHNPSLNLFICGALDEYNYLKSVLGYSEDEIKYTGFARFDYLSGKTKKQILLMPTWRNYLYNCDESTFKKSEYFKTYNSLLNNEKLSSLLSKNNLELIFYPHYEVQKFIHLFSTCSNNISIASIENFDVQKLLIESNILVTDYSSVFFDFAYMKKPILYYHFDYDKYRKTQYAEGYFKYDTHGFGDIVYKEDELINKIDYLINNKMDKKYLERINSFFQKNDSNNCDRIYKEIKKL